MARRAARPRPTRGPLLRAALALAVLSSVAVPATSAPAAAATSTGVTTGAVVVTGAADPADLDRVPGVTVDHQPGREHAVRAEVTAAGAAALAARPDVVAVEPDVPVGIDAGDPQHASNWGAHVLDLGSAWARTEGAGTVVAILDTGVAVHPELTGRLLAGADVIGGTGDGRGDPHGHGTMSALTVAAARDDGLGAIGVCPRCTVLPIRVLAADGGGSLSTITNGIHAALDRGADVISISASGVTSASPRFLVDAVARATAAGVPVVASAGNDGTDVQAFPAADPGVIGVAASKQDDTRYSWSNHGSWVDVAAPGCYRISDPVVPTTGRNYCGTSAAAPVVSGSIALARAAGRPADVAKLRAELAATSVSVPYVAGGRLDTCPLLSGGLVGPKVTLRAPQVGAALEDVPAVTLSARDDCGLTAVRVRVGTTTVATRALSGRSVTDLRLPLDLGAAPTGHTTLRVTVTDRHGRTGEVQVAVTHGDTPQTSSDPAPTAPSPTTPVKEPAPVTFGDVSGPHREAIGRLAARGVTTGCAPGRYCPEASVTRAQMATFLVRALDPAARTAAPTFRDVQGGTHADAIGRLAAARITAGCGDGRYCPGDSVTRAQMATFLVRALDLDAGSGTTPSFRDVRGGPHAEAIAQLAAAGITTGCGDGRFCPDDTVTRAQMASFLMRALDS